MPAYGGPGQPPPNYGYGTLPPPPGAKKTRWPWIVVGVILAGLLLIGGCVALVVRLASGPIDAANEFLADIAAEDYTAALAHLDPSCFGAGEASPDALQIFFGDSVTGYNLTSTSNDNNRTGSAGGTITRDGFGTQPVSFAMTKPADDWLVCGYRIGS